MEGHLGVGLLRRCQARAVHDPQRSPSPQEHRSSGSDDRGQILGVNRSIAYRILKGARNLTAAHIKKLSARFAVSADLLLA